MASGSERVPAVTPPVAEELNDALPRTDVDLETELEGLRDFVLRGGTSLINHRIWLDLEEFETRVEHVIALLPKEVRRARRICREEQRIVQDAKDEARRVLDEARAEAERRVADRLSASDAEVAAHRAERDKELDAYVERRRREADRLVEAARRERFGAPDQA